MRSRAPAVRGTEGPLIIYELATNALNAGLLVTDRARVDRQDRTHAFGWRDNVVARDIARQLHGGRIVASGLSPSARWRRAYRNFPARTTAGRFDARHLWRSVADLGRRRRASHLRWVVSRDRFSSVEMQSGC
jgi:hypothetical protein